MIITCPSCSARFVVKTESIGANGRKVRCAKCKHDWFQAPDQQAIAAVAAANPQPEPASTDPIPQGSNVPVAVKTKGKFAVSPLQLGFVGSILLLVLTVGIMQANSVLPKMAGFYKLFAIYDAKEIALYDVKVEKVDADKYTDLVITGKIVNQSSEEKHLPDLRISIYDKDKKKLKYITLASKGAMIAPGEKVDFKNQVPRIHKDSANVVIDLGNRIDLAIR